MLQEFVGLKAKKKFIFSTVLHSILLFLIVLFLVLKIYLIDFQLDLFWLPSVIILPLLIITYLRLRDRLIRRIVINEGVRSIAVEYLYLIKGARIDQVIIPFSEYQLYEKNKSGVRGTSLEIIILVGDFKYLVESQSFDRKVFEELRLELRKYASNEVKPAW